MHNIAPTAPTVSDFRTNDRSPALRQTPPIPPGEPSFPCEFKPTPFWSGTTDNPVEIVPPPPPDPRRPWKPEEAPDYFRWLLSLARIDALESLLNIARDTSNPREARLADLAILQLDARINPPGPAPDGPDRPDDPPRARARTSPSHNSRKHPRPSHRDDRPRGVLGASQWPRPNTRPRPADLPAVQPTALSPRTVEPRTGATPHTDAEPPREPRPTTQPRPAPARTTRPPEYHPNERTLIRRAPRSASVPVDPPRTRPQHPITERVQSDIRSREPP